MLDLLLNLYKFQNFRFPLKRVNMYKNREKKEAKASFQLGPIDKGAVKKKNTKNMQLKQRDQTGRLKDNEKILHMLPLYPKFFPQMTSSEGTTDEL